MIFTIFPPSGTQTKVDEAVETSGIAKLMKLLKHLELQMLKSNHLMFSFFYPIYLLRSVIDFKDQTKLLIE
jgi:hypothetical protein